MHRRVTSLTWLALCLAALGCQQPNDYVAPPPPLVTVAQPIEQPVQEYFVTTGQTQAAETVELRARVDGYLHDIRFEDGELVDENELLFVIKKEPFEIAVQMAQAELDKAHALEELARQQLTRATALAEEEATPMSNLDIREAEFAEATANVAAAEAALAEAELNRGYTEIRAPFAGRISRHLVDEGNLVQAELTLLATIESVSPMHAYFAVSEPDLLRFRELNPAWAMQTEGAPVVPIELALGDSGEFEFAGELDYQEFGIQTSTGTTMYRAEFTNENGALIPGMFVRVRMALGEPQPLLLVEERALAADQRGEYVTVVNGENTVEHRVVELGVPHEGLRSIRSGLAGDEWIVVNGLQRARPGVVVETKKAVMGAPPADENEDVEQYELGDEESDEQPPDVASNR